MSGERYPRSVSTRAGICFTRWQQWRIKRKYDAGNLLGAQRYILRILRREGLTR